MFMTVGDLAAIIERCNPKWRVQASMLNSNGEKEILNPDAPTVLFNKDADSFEIKFGNSMTLEFVGVSETENAKSLDATQRRLFDLIRSSSTNEDEEKPKGRSVTELTEGIFNIKE